MCLLTHRLRVVPNLKVLFLFFLAHLKPSYWIFYTTFVLQSCTIIFVQTASNLQVNDGAGVVVYSIGIAL